MHKLSYVRSGVVSGGVLVAAVVRDDAGCDAVVIHHRR